MQFLITPTKNEHSLSQFRAIDSEQTWCTKAWIKVFNSCSRKNCCLHPDQILQKVFFVIGFDIVPILRNNPTKTLEWIDELINWTWSCKFNSLGVTCHWMTLKQVYILTGVWNFRRWHGRTKLHNWRRARKLTTHKLLRLNTVLVSTWRYNLG